MPGGIPATLKVLREELAKFIAEARRDFEHILTSIGDLARDLDEIKTLLRTRKKP